jgi:mxaA protein
MRALKSLFTCLLLAVSVCAALPASADVTLPNVDNKYVTVKEINPTRDAGYVVGDKLERTIILTVKKPYELVRESLPIVGYEHRYRGQVSGVELAGISVEEENFSDRSEHTIHLVYQVFKSGRVVRPAILRGEIVKLRHNGKTELRQLRFPSFNFRTSPLSIYGEVNLKSEMSPLIPPFTISTVKEEQVLKIAAAVLALSLLGLLYILGANTWLPRMGGAFAKAYRKVGKLPDNEDGLQQAIGVVHQAIQQVAGHSVFGNNVAQFIQEKPAYQPARAEIERFFSLSRQVFFDVKTTPELGMPPKQWLRTFCRHMRDCERGLTPDLQADLHPNLQPNLKPGAK